jgi:DNA-binding transcriptional ArsR family regulator
LRRAIKATARSERSTRAASAIVFAALGDETRLRLVSRLCADGPLSIAKLAADHDITRQAITKHLRVMESAGLVRSAQQGRESVWQLEQKRLADAQRYLRQVSAQWDDVLGRLKRFVERR